VEQPTFNYLKDELLNRVKDAGSIDGVLLALHGSMVTGELDDPEGELLSALRQHLGQIPVVATFDLHANMTALKVKSLTALVGYHTSPHTDLFETGLKAGRVLFSTIRGKVRPRNHKAISFSVGGLQILCYGLEMTVIALRLRCPCSGPSGFEPLSCGSILSSLLSLVSR